ncbi:hypothetical protein U9M48_014644 [Paspalum notatum var. saurae]|uniref:Carboxypeptidase n=1 Tax=Paspalum notatum var. saurae TaxID=547442 RepID=A0AAQ3WKP4_PASNO
MLARCHKVLDTRFEPLGHDAMASMDSKGGGYVQQYTGGFTFISVRAAGHEVPSYQPERALILLHSFLKGVLPPYIQEQ